LPAAYFGFPQVLSIRERFDEAAGEQMSGLVSEVLEHYPQGYHVDFVRRQDVASRVRRPNFEAFGINSRFGRLANAILVPFGLGSSDESARRESVGVLRLLNCGTFGATGNLELADERRLEAILEEVRRTAQRLGLLYARLLNTAHRDLVATAMHRILDTNTLREFVEWLMGQLGDILDFATVVMWQPQPTEATVKLVPFCSTTKSPAWTKNPVDAESNPARAFTRRALVDELVERKDPRGTLARTQLPVNNGFNIPVLVGTGKESRAVLGCYNYWARPGGPYEQALRTLSTTIAGLVALKIETAEARGTTDVWAE
jgi:hypothetical protein